MVVPTKDLWKVTKMEDEIVVNGELYVRKEVARNPENLQLRRETRDDETRIYGGRQTDDNYCVCVEHGERRNGSTVAYFWSDDLPEGWEFYTTDGMSEGTILVNVRRKKANG